MMAWIEARAWQLGTIASLAFALFMSGLWLSATLERRAVEGDLAAAKSRSADLQADMDTCKTNTQGLETALRGQNDAIDQIQKASAARMAAADIAMKQAIRSNEDLQRRIDRVVQSSTGSSDLCDRLLAVDKTALEVLR